MRFVGLQLFTHATIVLLIALHFQRISFIRPSLAMKVVLMIFLLACVVHSLSTFNQFILSVMSCSGGFRISWGGNTSPRGRGANLLSLKTCSNFSFEDTPTSTDIWWPKLVRLASGWYATYWNALELMCFQFCYLDRTIKDICNINSD